MKRVFCLILTVALALSLAACGARTQEEGTLSADSHSVLQPEKPASSVAQPEQGYTSSVDPEVFAAAPEQPSSMTPESVPQVEITTVADDRTGETGDAYLLFSYDVAKVEVPGNEAAAAAIQAGLDALTEDILEQAELMSAGGPEDEGMGTPYFLKQTLSVTRLDTAVLSIQVRLETYLGGAHGSVLYTGLSFDPSTGARLTLESLGSGVKDASVASVTALADVIAADQESFFFSEYQEGIVTSVVTDDFFYLTEDGIVFVDNEYNLQSYAGGVVFFTVGYDGLADSLDARFALPGAPSSAVLSDGSRYTLEGRVSEGA